MSQEDYSKSFEMEIFLKGILDVQPNSKIDYDLKDPYRTILFYEQGLSKVSPAVHKKTYARYMSYFGKAIDRMAKKYPAQKVTINQLKAGLPEMETASEMMWLYEQLRAISK